MQIKEPQSTGDGGEDVQLRDSKQMKLEDNRRRTGNEIAQVVGEIGMQLRDGCKGKRHRGWG